MILQEYLDVDYKVITEDVGSGKKKTYLRGIFQKAGVKNANSRVYPIEILEREINRNREKLLNRQMLGELDHPSSGKINLNKVSHCITKLEIDAQGNVIGEAEVFDGPDEEGGTPAGRILSSLLKRGVKIGISSRGIGSLKSVGNGVSEVNDDYKLITFDVVANPSTPGAYPEKIVEDTEEWGLRSQEEKVALSELLNENL